jgi:CHAT domain-containing protein
VTSADEDIEWACGLHLDRAPLPVRRQAARDRIVAARLRVARTGDSCDYKALVALCTARLRITPGYYRDRHQAVVTLVNVLQDRHVSTGDIEPLRQVAVAYDDEARQILSHRRWFDDALARAATWRLRAVRARRALFRIGGNVGDLDRALADATTVITETETTSRVRREAMDLKASILRQRFRARGDRTDLDVAVDLGRELLDAARRAAALRDIAWSLGGLGQSLAIRAEAFGSKRVDDHAEALACFREAVGAQPPSDVWAASRLASLAGQLRLQADDVVRAGVATPTGVATRTGIDPHVGARAVAILDEAIATHHLAARGATAANARTGHVPWATTDLAQAYLDRHAITGDATDLQHVVRVALGAWDARRGQVGLGVLDTALVVCHAIRRIAGPTDRVGIVTALASTGASGGVPLAQHYVDVLDRANTVMDGVLGAEWVGEGATERHVSNTYRQLREWLIEWHADAACHARRRGHKRDARTHGYHTLEAVERAKQRRMVAHLDVGALRPAPDAAELLARLTVVTAQREALLSHARDGDAGTSLGRTAATNGARIAGWQSEEAERASNDTRLAELGREIGDLHAEIARTDPAYAAARGFVRPSDARAVVDHLPRGTCVVTLYPLDEAVVVVGITAGRRGRDPRVRVAAAPLARSDLDTWQQRIFGSGRQTHWWYGIDGVLKTLSRRLVPALCQVVPGWEGAVAATDPARVGARQRLPRLVLIPTGALHRFPLHAIPLDPADDTRDQRCLIDCFVTTYATTADLLPRVIGRGASPDGVAAVAPGLAETPGSRVPHATVALAQATATAVRRTGVTGEDGARVMVCVREGATRRAVIEDGALRNRRLAMVATHGRAGEAGAREAGLLLHDGTDGSARGAWLVAAEILAALPLDGVEHLHLLACDTHAESPAPGDHLAGLMATLLLRGARSVGATLWTVNEVPAICVAWWFARQMLRGRRDKAAAFRGALLRLRDATCVEVGEALAEILRAVADRPDADRVSIADLREAVQKIDDLSAFERVTKPFARTDAWGAFVFHGAPRCYARS